MKVAVVGAGISGIGAARTLLALGHEAVVFESKAIVGGRIATVREGGYVFDSGATHVAPRGRALEPAMRDDIDTEGLVKIERPIYTHQSLRVSPGDASKMTIDRYCYRQGLEVLPQRLAANLDVRLQSPVETLKRTNGTLEVGGEAFEAAILAIPSPEATPLLESLGEKRPFANSQYRPCLSVMLGYRNPPPDVPYHALVEPENTHPLAWLSLETLKSPGRSPEGSTALVAQLGPQFSKLRFDSPDLEIIETVADSLVRLYGKDWETPEVALVKRWRHSQPEMTALFDNVNRPHAKIAIAGDGVMGGRTEYAYEAGVKAAKLIAGEPSS